MRTPHYEHDSRIIEPRKCGKDRVRERPDQGNRIERFLHLGGQIIRVGVLPLQFFPQLGPHLRIEPARDHRVRAQDHAGSFSFEAANPRHEHEYHLFERMKIPEGKVLCPGVVTHAGNIVEHRELIAERLIRFANLIGRRNVNGRRGLRVLFAGPL
jgi:hypothetical protein